MCWVESQKIWTHEQLCANVYVYYIAYTVVPRATTGVINYGVVLD